MAESYFLPPVDPSYRHSRDRFRFFDTDGKPVRTYASKGAYVGFTRTPRGLDVNKRGGITITGVDYLGGRWNGPLTSQQVTDLTAAGYAARIVTVADVGHLPSGLD